MADPSQPPRSRLDEIVLSGPGYGDLCNSLAQRRAGVTAQVVVTFGELGTVYPDALWLDCWHRTHPMRGPCWQNTSDIAQRARPASVIRDATSPPAATAASGPRG